MVTYYLLLQPLCGKAITASLRWITRTSYTGPYQREIANKGRLKIFQLTFYSAREKCFTFFSYIINRNKPVTFVFFLQKWNSDYFGYFYTPCTACIINFVNYCPLASQFFRKKPLFVAKQFPYTEKFGFLRIAILLPLTMPIYDLFES